MSTIKGKIGNKLKGFAGGFGRLVLIMFVLQPFLQKPITKLVHKIFGEPKAYLAKEKAAEEAEKAKDNQQQNAQNTQVVTPQAQIPTSNTNLINMYSQPQVAQQPQAYNPQQQVSNPQQPFVVPTQAPASQPIAAAPVSNSGRYIPSITVNHAAQDTSAIDAQADAILRSTDALMARARKCL